MTDQIDFTGRFDLPPSDGIHCFQVCIDQALIENESDLEYWKNQAKQGGYLMAFDYHVPQNALFDNVFAYDVYQIFPPEQAENFKNLTMA